MYPFSLYSSSFEYIAKSALAMNHVWLAARVQFSTQIVNVDFDHAINRPSATKCLYTTIYILNRLSLLLESLVHRSSFYDT